VVNYHSRHIQLEDTPLETNRTTRGIRLLFLCLVVFQVGPIPAEWDVPEELSGKVNALDEQQQAFITSGAAIEIIPERQLTHELATRDAESMMMLLNDLMSVAEQMGYSEDRDMGAAPLNLDSKRFNHGVTTTPELRDMEREPGPFSIHRYLNPSSGVPTFGGANVAIWPEDLVAGNVDVAIVGVPNDMSSGKRDAGWAPFEMRALNTIAAPDGQSLLKPFEVLSIVDYGNIRVDRMSTERSIDHISDMIAETASTGAIPMMVGGDTSILYPGVRGLSQVHGTRSFGLVHFSAHPDVERHSDHTISDRQALFRLLDQDIVEGEETVLFGLRGADVDVSNLSWLRDQGVRYHTMVKIRERGYAKVLKEVQREVERGPNAFFVSIDVSVLQPSEMVAAGRIEPNGAEIDEITRVIRHVCAAREIVGFQITDLAPVMDYSRLSALNANAVLNACLAGMTVRKAGLKPDYIHPLALDHGQR